VADHEQREHEDGGDADNETREGHGRLRGLGKRGQRPRVSKTMAATRGSYADSVMMCHGDHAARSVVTCELRAARHRFALQCRHERPKASASPEGAAGNSEGRKPWGGVIPNPVPAPKGRQIIAKGVSPGQKTMASRGNPGLAPFAILRHSFGAKTNIVLTYTHGFRPGLVSNRPFGAAHGRIPHAHFAQDGTRT
jgi:hypothetical protein